MSSSQQSLSLHRYSTTAWRHPFTLLLFINLIITPIIITNCFSIKFQKDSHNSIKGSGSTIRMEGFYWLVWSNRFWRIARPLKTNMGGKYPSTIIWIWVGNLKGISCGFFSFLLGIVVSTILYNALMYDWHLWFCPDSYFTFFLIFS